MMKRMTVATQLSLGFGFLVIFQVICSFVGVSGMMNTQARMDDVILDKNVNVMNALSMQTLQQHVGNSVRNMIIDNSDAGMAREREVIKTSRATYDELYRKLDEALTLPEERRLLAEVKAQSMLAGDANDKVVTLGAANQDTEATEYLLNQAAPESRKWNVLLSQLAEQQQKQSLASAQEASASNRFNQSLLTGLSAFSSLLGLVTGFLIIRSLRQQLGGEPAEVARIAGKIAEGDLGMAIPLRENDQASIMASMQQVKHSLTLLVSDSLALSEAATRGQLSTRADARQHQGKYREVIEGVNATLDALTGPLEVVANHLERIAQGNIPPPISAHYQGDFDRIKNNLNLAIEATNTLVGDTARLSRGIVEGDLSLTADVLVHRGDYRKIMESFDQAYEGLNGVFHQFNNAIDQLGQSARQFDSASQNMASTSEEQSASVEQITASLAQTDSQVKFNTETAFKANQLVVGAAEAAQQGRARMDSMMEAMKAIHASAQNIAKIIKVIDEIAFQTNLLALNAAVEAARAGQHGRGFAVVAQEVRNLAGRSAKAARETANLIDDSTRRVREGVESAENTQEALHLIVTNVVKIKDLMAEISTASQEQSRGVGQINTAMNQVTLAAQEGSQQAEELAASANELTSMATRLQREVSRFRLRPLHEASPQSEPAVEARSAPPLPVTLPRKARTVREIPPKAVLPLDHDERGFGGF